MGRAIVTKDFLAGLMFVAFGLLGLWLGRTLEAGTASAMEAGYFPRLVCGLLIAVGAALAVISWLRGDDDAPERGTWRPFVLITFSALAFALLLQPLGLVLTLADQHRAGARRRRRLAALSRLLLACAVLIAAIVGIFVLALRMPIPLWPAVF